MLVVAGDIPQGIGEFSSALQILEGGFLEKHGIRKIGVAGHPEGHKDVSDPALRDAIVRKNAYADKTGADVQIVTQFVFLPEPVIKWEAANGEINHLPFRVGLPGLATLKTLLKYAIDCGAGPSLAAVSKHATNLTKLVTVSAPDEVVVGLAQYRAAAAADAAAGCTLLPVRRPEADRRVAREDRAGQLRVERQGRLRRRLSRDSRHRGGTRCAMASCSCFCFRRRRPRAGKQAVGRAARG